MRLTDKARTFRQGLVFRAYKERAMQTKTGGCSTCIALVLAATTAIMSLPGQADDTCQNLRLLCSIVAPAADDVAGAISDHPQNLLPP
jgi:hypothetical protein